MKVFTMKLNVFLDIGEKIQNASFLVGAFALKLFYYLFNGSMDNILTAVFTCLLWPLRVASVKFTPCAKYVLGLGSDQMQKNQVNSFHSL